LLNILTISKFVQEKGKTKTAVGKFGNLKEKTGIDFFIREPGFTPDDLRTGF
jgi:hypothetical protein